MKKTIKREVIFYGKDGKPVAKETKFRFDSGASGFFVEYMVGGKWQFSSVKGVSDEVRAMVRDYRDSRISAGKNAERNKNLLKTLLASRFKDTVAKEIVIVLCEQSPVGKMRFRSSDMSDAIVKQFGGDESAKRIFSPRRIGMTIMKFEQEFSELFRWTSSILNGLTYYNFSGLNPEIAGGVR